MRKARHITSLLLTVMVLHGLASAQGAVLFPAGSTWKYLKGFGEASSPDPTAWRVTGFDDGAWSSGPAPFYYGEPLTGTLLSDMANNYACFFLRQTFVVTNASAYSALVFNAACDDGYIAWVNGVEIARYNMPTGFVAFNALALGSVPEPVTFMAVTNNSPASFLVTGTNVASVQVFNFAINSADIVFHASLSALVDTNPPVVATLQPPGASVVRTLRSVQVTFNEAVTNVDATDLLENGQPATNLLALGPSQYLFEFPPPPTGSVVMSFAAGHGIRDLAPAQNAFLGATWGYTLDPNAPPEQVRISEFMAANASTIADNDGDFSDWIELQNAGTNIVNLAGWFLTDDAAVPTKWRVPAVTLTPGQFKLVWASAKNRTNAAAPLHTNFRLDRGGGYLALLDADTNAVSVFNPYPSQFSEVSYGRDPLLPGATGYFGTPTPGAANAAQFSGRTDAPGFSHKRGFYDTNFSLVLTSETAGATIYFTTNGTPPSPTNGVAYVAPLDITNTTVIRAAAFASGLLPSDTHTHSFLFTRDIIRQSPGGAAPPGWPSSWGANVVDYGMDPNVVNDPRYTGTIEGDLRMLPSLCLVMKLDDLFDPSEGIYANPGNDGIDWERPTSVELIYGNGADGFQAGAGLRLRGGFSRNTANPKHSFRFIFREEFGAAKLTFPLFGPTGASSFDKFDLRTAQDNSYAYVGDPNGTFLPDPFARDTLGAMGRPYTRGDFYHVFINGVYWGVYNTEERPEASYAASYFGGVPEDYDVVKVEAGAYDVFATDGDLGAWLRLWQAATNGFALDADYERVQGHNPDGSPNPAYEVLVDMDNLIDYMLLTIYSGNYDGPVYLDFFPNNFYAWRNRNTRDGFRFVTHDAELCITDVNYDRTTTITVGDPAAGSSFSESNPQYIWQRLWANAEFRLRTADRVQKLFFNNGPCTPAACMARYAARTNELFRGMVGESARWGDAQREPAIVRDNWVNAVSSVINNYFPARTTRVLQQLRNRGLFPSLAAPGFSQLGGAVPAGYALTLSHTNAAGIIQYTVDGTDPRLRGGAVAPGAQTYISPVVINAPTVVRARVRNGTIWSALMEATFFPPQDLSGLRVTEIMYNPPKLGLVDGDELEFIELKNTGATLIDLTGLSFTTGISFNFTNNTRLAPGQFWLLARNAAQFVVKYPGAVINGLFTGKLDNSGETLRVTSVLSNVVLELTYDDVTPWPLAADGFGFSLVAVQPSGCSGDSPQCWRASTNPGGSPGADDPPATIARVVINELLSRPSPPGLDTIELFNPTTNDVDIGGWFITDDAAIPKKFRVPEPTIITAGGFAVFDELQFNPTPGTNGSFAFSSRGDDVFLFSGNETTNLTGYSHGFSFDGAGEGVGFGRHITSTGEEHFTAQSASTFGAINAAPRVGPVVINEINYHPAPEHDEFIELRNITESPMELFDPAHPTNAWRLNGAGFVFPTNVTLVPGGFALVTALVPTAFRVKYAIPIEVPIFGPLAGLLQDSGERLELQRPEIPDTNGLLWITVDAVRYNDKVPWPPGADGDGPSLQRLDSTAYGDDPTNWFASGITPGAVNAFNQPPTVALTAPANGAIFTGASQLLLTASASDVDGTVTRVEFFDSGVKLGEDTNAPFSLVWSNAAVGTHTLTAKARDNGLAVTESSPVGITIRQPVFTNLTLVATGAVWRYHDKGQNLGTNWIALTYNDSGWSNGPAQLGYGDGDEATVVSYGPTTVPKYITTYFRRTFVNSSPMPFTALTLRVVRDDGVLVWLNGVEIFRDNMPGGAVAYDTLASTALGVGIENLFISTNLPLNALASGTNILAVEIHQGTVDSSDISFDLELTATLVQPDPQLSLAFAGDSALLRWPAPAGAYHLEGTSDLTPPALWSPITNAPANDGYWKSLALTNAPGLGQRFFRLNRL